MKFLKLTLVFFFAVMTAKAATIPSLSLKNQFGEISNNFVVGGSGAITMKFIVDSSNANGLGLRSLTTTGGGDAVAQVYMNTSATPATGNPNPSPGYVIVKFSKSYQDYLAGSVAVINPPSPSFVSISAGLQQGKPYSIYAVGTTTAAQWQALGFPSNLTPTPSPSFIATTGAPGVGTGQVEPLTSAGSGVYSFEIIGTPSVNLHTNDGTGGELILGLFGATSSTSTTLVPKAPANGTYLELSFTLAPVAGSPL